MPFKAVPYEPAGSDRSTNGDNIEIRVRPVLANAQTGYPKSAIGDVYAYIIEELENVVANGVLEKSTAQNGGGRASLESARALLAKTYLAAAWDLDKKEYFF